MPESDSRWKGWIHENASSGADLSDKVCLEQAGSFAASSEMFVANARALTTILCVLTTRTPKKSNAKERKFERPKRAKLNVYELDIYDRNQKEPTAVIPFRSGMDSICG
jgi:hypothetical protein